MIIFSIFQKSSKKDCCTITIKPADEEKAQTEECCEVSVEACCS